MNAATFRLRVILIVALGALAAFILLLLPPIPQDALYHEFVDRRAVLGVPNLFDAVSSLALAAAGAIGLLFLRRARLSPNGPLTEPWERTAFAVLFIGAVFTAAGSLYYHLAPDDARLFWDRLPMSVLFMAFLSITLGERIGMRVGRLLFVPLVSLGIASVVWWRMAGDLRAYILVQFYPMLALPLLLLLFPPRYTRAADLFAAMGCYGLAKVFEMLDAPIFEFTGVVSGHTLKHLAAGLAIWFIARSLERRRSTRSRGAPEGTSGSPGTRSRGCRPR